MHPEYIAPTEFESFLNIQKGERGISAFLKERPQLLYWATCRAGGHCRFVFREFPLGASFVCDFVVVNSYSGVWEVKFIELEPVDAQVFTKAGTAAKRLAGAVKQVDDWADYYETNKLQVRADLVEWAKTRDILGYSEGKRPSNLSGDYLSDPLSYLAASFHIYIGRREMMDQAGHRRKAQYNSRHAVEVASYDRLLDLVKDRYCEPGI